MYNNSHDNINREARKTLKEDHTMAKTFNNYFIHFRNTLRKKKKATSDNK